MKYKRILLLLSTCLTSLCYAEPRAEFTKFTKEEIEADSDLKANIKSDPNYSKFVWLSLYDFPLNEEITYSTRRLVIDSVKNKETYQEKGRFEVIDKNKIHMLVKGRDTRHCLPLTTPEFLPGERIYLRFQTKDGNTICEKSWIPIPMKVSNKSTTISIEAELIMINPEFYKLTIIGLQDGEKYTFKSISGPETLENDQTYSAKQAMVTCPGTLAEEGGIAKISITTKSKEKLTLNVPWGTKLLDYVEGEIYKP